MDTEEKILSLVGLAAVIIIILFAGIVGYLAQ
jgi:hypothetical protein